MLIKQLLAEEVLEFAQCVVGLTGYRYGLGLVLCWGGLDEVLEFVVVDVIC